MQTVRLDYYWTWMPTSMPHFNEYKMVIALHADDKYFIVWEPLPFVTKRLSEIQPVQGYDRLFIVYSKWGCGEQEVTGESCRIGLD